MSDFKLLHHRNRTIIDGEKMSYFACSEGSLETAKENNTPLQYIGSSHKIIVEGKELNFKMLHHFFR